MKGVVSLQKQAESEAEDVVTLILALISFN